MRRIRISTVVFGFLAFVALGVAIGCEYGRRTHDARMASMTPLRMALPQDKEGFREAFTAGWSTSHYVALVFPNDIDTETKALLKRAWDERLNLNRPRFDFFWKVFEGSTQVGQGSGHDASTGVSGTHDLQFGEFPAQARHTYVIEVRLGPGLDRFSGASPELAISVNEASPSIGLAIERDLGGPVALIAALVGLTFLGCAIASLRPRPRNTNGRI